jgi:hypothetical protein
VPNSGSGTTTVCAYAINVKPPNSNPQLGCLSLVVHDDPPLGSLDAITVAGNQARVFGWSFDPNASATSIPVHIYVGDVGYAFRADQRRDDVNAVFGITGRHGFSATVPLPAGSSQICAFSIGLHGKNPLIGCRTVRSGVNAVSPLAVPAPAPTTPAPAPTTPEPTTSAPSSPPTPAPPGSP